MYVVEVQRLHQVVVGPALERPHRSRHGTVGRHQQHRHLRIGIANGSQHLDAVDIRQHQVGQDHVDLALAKPLQARLSCRRDDHLVAGVFDGFLDRTQAVRIVFNHQNARFFDHTVPVSLSYLI